MKKSIPTKIARTKLVRASLAVALLATVAMPASAKPLDRGTAAALATIKRDADGIAAGRYGSSLQSPAHEIGVAWYEAARSLANNGDVVVEMKMTNASITKFEADWRDGKRARIAARDVSVRIAELIAATRS